MIQSGITYVCLEGDLAVCQKCHNLVKVKVMGTRMWVTSKEAIYPKAHPISNNHDNLDDPQLILKLL